MVSELRTKIEIRCPACNKMGIIKIEENIINRSERGITAVNIAEHLICEHSFVAYIDKHLAVRDCFICDFKIELPKIEIEQKESKIYQEFDINIIKYTLIPSLMVYALKGIISGKSIVVISDFDHLSVHFINFFNFLISNTFKAELLFLPYIEYKKRKKELKNHIVFQGNKIINGKDKSFNSKNIKIESSIIQNFFSEYDSKIAIIRFKNEILKLYKLSQDLITINNNLKEKEEFISKNALDYIYQKYNTKISYNYLSLLIEIVENYFDVKLKKSTESADLLGYI